MIKKIFFITFPLFSFVFLFTFRSISEEKPIIWKCSNFGTASIPFNMLTVWFFRELEARSGVY